MTDDPVAGSGPRPGDAAAHPGAAEFLNAPTVRARIHPRSATPPPPAPHDTVRSAPPRAPDRGSPADPTATVRTVPPARPAREAADPGDDDTERIDDVTERMTGVTERLTDVPDATVPFPPPPAGATPPPYPTRAPEHPQPSPPYPQYPPAHPPGQANYAAAWQAPYPPAAARSGPGPGLVVGVAAGLLGLLAVLVGGGWYLLGSRGSAPSAAPGPSLSRQVTEPGTPSVDPSDDPTGDPTGDPTDDVGSSPVGTTARHPAAVDGLRVGDCVESLSGTRITRVTVVDCTAPHQLQLVGEYTPKRGRFPGHDALFKAAQGRCAATFEAAVRHDAPEVANLPLVPSQATWQRGDRRVLCFAAAPDTNEPLDASVLDSTTT